MGRSLVTATATAMTLWIAAIAWPSGHPSGGATSAPQMSPISAAASAGGTIEHRYRVIGKIRLLFFWTGGTVVGGARLTKQIADEASSLALLVGSDPDIAPRRLNQWGYVREVVRPDGADVFAVKNLTSASPIMPGKTTSSASGPFGAMCSSVNGSQVRSIVTAFAPDKSVTYKRFGQMLDALVAVPEWTAKDVEQPPGAAPGFLTALERVTRGAGTGASHETKVTYAFNGNLFDLVLQNQKLLRNRMVGAALFDRLVRDELTITERASGEVTDLVATFEPDGKFAPVQLIVQPNFWLNIEVQRDDEADVPADPASDASTLTRIENICLAARP